MSQEEAAERLGRDRTSLGRVENIVSPYSQALLEAAAELYRCTESDLLNVNPLRDGEIVNLNEVLQSATPEQRAEIIGFARGRVRPDADN